MPLLVLISLADFSSNSVLLFRADHFYIKSLAMRQGSLFSRFMRWFEGVSLSPASLAKVTTDAQTGHAILASTSATEEAIRAGAEVTKNNAMIGSHQLAVAALPVSYLEGNNYYRVGGDNSKLTHLHPEAALHGHADGRAYDAAAAHQQWPSKMEDGDAPVGARFSHPAPGTQFEHDTAVRIHTTAPGQAPPGVRMPAELAHNEQLPVPILVTGEAAAQEDREVRQVEMV